MLFADVVATATRRASALHHRFALVAELKFFASLFVALAPLSVLILAGCSSAQVTEQKTASAQRAASPLPVNPTASARTALKTVLTPQALAEGVQPGKAKDLFIKGATLQMQERWAEAILEFQQALRYDNNAAIHFAIAQNYGRLSKQELAQEELREAIRQDSNFLPAYKALGESYVAQMKVDEAIAIYSFLIEREPDAQTRFTLARLYEFRNVDKAIEMYAELLSESNKHDINENILLSQLAKLYTDKGNSDELIKVLERLYSSAPENKYVAEMLLRTYLFQKRLDKAFALLSAVEQQLSEQETMRYSLIYGNTLLQMFDSVAMAKELSNQFLKRAESRTKSAFASSWEYQLLCGMLAGNLNNEAQTRWYFDRSLAIGDTTVDVPLQISFFYFQKRQFRDIINVTSKYTTKFPNNPQLPYLTGIAFAQIDSSAQAIRALRRSVQIDPAYIDAWSQLGILYNSAGQIAQSDSAYERVLQIDPDNPLVNNNFAYSFSERNINLDRAEKMIERALRAEPKNPSYLDTMGWILYQRGKYAPAAEFIKQAIENGDTNATIYEHLGDAYHKLGKSSAALEAWNEAIRKDPNRSSTKQRLQPLQSGK